jgi:hypothetical protein
MSTNKDQTLDHTTKFDSRFVGREASSCPKSPFPDSFDVIVGEIEVCQRSALSQQ